MFRDAIPPNLTVQPLGSVCIHLSWKARLRNISLLVLLIVSFSSTLTSQTYTVTVLDPPGAIVSVANGINDSGQVVGDYSDGVGPHHGFLYDNGSYTNIDVPGAAWTTAQGINNYGWIVGWYRTPADEEQGFVYVNGHYYPVALGDTTQVHGINDSGQTVGYFEHNGHFAFLGLYPPPLSGPIFQYQTFTVPGISYPVPWGINNNGQIVGTDPFDGHGFVGTLGTFSTIDYPAAGYTTASGINNGGQVVGETDSGLYIYSAGNFTTIALPFTLCFGYQPFGINDNGQIVGFFCDAALNAHGFLATPVGYNLIVGPMTPSPVTPGTSSNSTITLTSVGGYSGIVTIHCASGSLQVVCPPDTKVLAPSTGLTETITTNGAQPLTYVLSFSATDANGLPPSNGNPQNATLVVSNGGGTVALGTFIGLLCIWAGWHKRERIMTRCRQASCSGCVWRTRSRASSLSREFVIRCLLAALLVTVAELMPWRWLRYATSEVILRASEWLGIVMTRVSFDTIRAGQTLFRFDVPCTFVDVLAGAIVLLWRLHKPLSRNVLWLVVLAAALAAFNFTRLEVGHLLYHIGMPWALADSFLGGVAYFVVWLGIWKQHTWSVATSL